MKKFLATLLAAATLFFASTASAEVKTYTGTDEYIMSEFETIDIANAFADVNRAIELDPNFALALSNRAGLYLMTRNVEQTFTDANKAISLDPKLDLPYMIRGTCHQMFGNMAQAQADFAKARQLGYSG